MINKYCIYILLLLPLFASAQKQDTSGILKRFAGDLRQVADAGYDYTMEATFPNKEKSLLTGSTYLNTAGKIYYNDCNEFTMLYTRRWYYKADHKSKTVAIIDLNKESDKKLRAQREKEIFGGGALNAFLDSFRSGKCIIKRLDGKGSAYTISLGFPAQAAVKAMTVCFDTVQHLPVSCDMTVMQPWQRTAKGIELTKVEVHFKNFKRPTAKEQYSEAAFFSKANNKTILKKYCGYKITSKI